MDAYQLVDCPEVVDYKEFKRNAQHIVDPRCFDLVIDELVRRGEVSVGKTKKGDKILKFKVLFYFKFLIELLGSI